MIRILSHILQSFESQQFIDTKAIYWFLLRRDNCNWFFTCQVMTTIKDPKIRRASAKRFLVSRLRQRKLSLASVILSEKKFMRIISCLVKHSIFFSFFFQNRKTTTTNDVRVNTFSRKTFKDVCGTIWIEAFTEIAELKK